MHHSISTLSMETESTQPSTVMPRFVMENNVTVQKQQQQKQQQQQQQRRNQESWPKKPRRYASRQLQSKSHAIANEKLSTPEQNRSLDPHSPVPRSKLDGSPNSYNSPPTTNSKHPNHHSQTISTQTPLPTPLPNRQFNQSRPWQQHHPQTNQFYTPTPHQQHQDTPFSPSSSRSFSDLANERRYLLEKLQRADTSATDLLKRIAHLQDSLSPPHVSSSSNSPSTSPNHATHHPNTHPNTHLNLSPRSQDNSHPDTPSAPPPPPQPQPQRPLDRTALRKTKNLIGWFKNKLQKTTQQEQRILGRLGQLSWEIQCRERWMRIEADRRCGVAAAATTTPGFGVPGEEMLSDIGGMMGGQAYDAAVACGFGEWDMNKMNNIQNANMWNGLGYAEPPPPPPLFSPSAFTPSATVSNFPGFNDGFDNGSSDGNGNGDYWSFNTASTPHHSFNNGGDGDGNGAINPAALQLPGPNRSFPLQFSPPPHPPPHLPPFDPYMPYHPPPSHIHPVQQQFPLPPLPEAHMRDQRQMGWKNSQSQSQIRETGIYTPLSEGSHAPPPTPEKNHHPSFTYSHPLALGSLPELPEEASSFPSPSHSFIAGSSASRSPFPASPSYHNYEHNGSFDDGNLDLECGPDRNRGFENADPPPSLHSDVETGLTSASSAANTPRSSNLNYSFSSHVHSQSLPLDLDSGRTPPPPIVNFPYSSSSSSSFSSSFPLTAIPLPPLPASCLLSSDLVEENEEIQPDTDVTPTLGSLEIAEVQLPDGGAGPERAVSLPTTTNTTTSGTNSSEMMIDGKEVVVRGWGKRYSLPVVGSGELYFREDDSGAEGWGERWWEEDMEIGGEGVEIG